MRILKTKIKSLFVVKQKNNFDKRGMLRETFNKKILVEEVNFDNRFFNIDINKFKSETGEVFKLNLRENLKSISSRWDAVLLLIPRILRALEIDLIFPDP